MSCGAGMLLAPQALWVTKLEPDPKVVEQYQRHVIQPSLRRDGGNDGMDWYCPARA
jgi:hypothetical protein